MHAAALRTLCIALATLALLIVIGFRLADQLGHASATVVPYPAVVRQHFMNSCITGGRTQSSCACSLDGIQAHYSLKDFAALDARAQSGQPMPPELVRIVSGCNAPH